jgi:crotonobetainyl-CoA:carnitine CoA-transferase CaiB-like acyl-CoA transferase
MLLTPYRVIELAGPLGSLAGRILADLGADVILVEPPEGDPARARPPHLRCPDGTRQSLAWLVVHANKRGVTLDLTRADGRARLRDLVRDADFLVESFPPGYLGSLGLGYADLSALNPRLIVVSVTPFGQQGPYATWRASDLEIMALSGAMSLAGEEGGEPMRVTVPQAAMWAGVEAAMGALTALAYRTASGRGQHVDVSAQAAVVSALAHAPVFWDLNGINPERAGIYVTGRSITGAKMRAFWKCRDGWINFIIYGGAAGRETNEQLVAWMAERGMAPEWLQRIDWSRFDVTTLDQDEVDRLEAPIARFFETVTKQEFLEEAVRRDMLGYPVATVADIYADRQLAARAFWQEVVDAHSGQPLPFPGGFALVDGVRLPIRRPAPRLGEHNEEVFAALNQDILRGVPGSP